jgi:hypothetical protein
MGQRMPRLSKAMSGFLYFRPLLVMISTLAIIIITNQKATAIKK